MSGGDRLVSLEAVEDADAQIFTVTEKGFGKRTRVSDYRVTNRGGKGIITVDTTAKNGKVISAFQVTDATQLILITSPAGKVIRVNVSEVRITGRITQGVRIVRLDSGEKIAAAAKVVEREDAGEEIQNTESANGIGGMKTGGKEKTEIGAEKEK